MDRQVVSRPGIGATARVLQRRALFMGRIAIDAPSLITVDRGSKHLRWPGGECLLVAGDAVAIAAGVTCDVVNTPDDAGLYAAQWLTCDGALIADFAGRRLTGSPIRDILPLPRRHAAFGEALRHARHGILERDAVPDGAAVARILEMLAWLDQAGGYFLADEPTAVARRVRLIVAADVAARWAAPAVASRLGMSEATLRRRLAEEGTSFSALLVDARMSRAMSLLQMTDLQVTQIAFETGYASPSRFAVRFRQRFGYPPSSVRQPERPAPAAIRPFTAAETPLAAR